MSHINIHQAILTSDIGNNNPERTSAGNTKSINTPNVIDIQTPAITDNPLQDSIPASNCPEMQAYIPQMQTQTKMQHISR